MGEALDEVLVRPGHGDNGDIALHSARGDGGDARTGGCGCGGACAVALLGSALAALGSRCRTLALPRVALGCLTLRCRALSRRALSRRALLPGRALLPYRVLSRRALLPYRAPLP
ncbi:hypothetical protein GCM10010166_06660 [Couchioplanes caeruleus subsp. azureus]|nr:hypothetical protein GCM10010166_06660 [Couchioplanes caeruleus subsp. azureus]